MKTFRILVITLIIYCGSVLTDNSNENYCKLNCFDKEHTLCKYTKSGPSSVCTDVVRSGLNDSEKKQIVDLHNKLRQYVASGNEKRGKPGPQPAAIKMPNLEWDEELALIAQRWVDQCDYDHDCGRVERFDVGQNIAEIETSNDNTDIGELVQTWYDEVDFYNGQSVSLFIDVENDDGEVVGHYTQMLWAETTMIGCGFILYKRGGEFVNYLVCNYGKSGNVQTEPVYLSK